MEKSESEVTQLCPTLFGLMDCSLPGSSVHGIFQARVLEWVAISFSRRSSWPRDWTWVSRIVDRHFYCLSHQGSPAQMEEQWLTFWLVVYRVWGKACRPEWGRCLACRSACGSLCLHPTPSLWMSGFVVRPSPLVPSSFCHPLASFFSFFCLLFPAHSCVPSLYSSPGA